jgi:hypothetical protein
MLSRAPLGELVVRAIDAIRQEAAQARGLWQDFGWELLDETEQRTDSSFERGFRIRRSLDDEWGRSESLDPDNVGDIADEGMGHRGSSGQWASRRTQGFSLNSLATSRLSSVRRTERHNAAWYPVNGS